MNTEIPSEKTGTDVPDHSPEELAADAAINQAQEAEANDSPDPDATTVSDAVERAGLLGADDQEEPARTLSEAELREAVDHLSDKPGGDGDRNKSAGDTEEDKLTPAEVSHIGAAFEMGSAAEAARKVLDNQDIPTHGRKMSSEIEPDIEPQCIKIVGIGGTNQVSIVTYDLDGKIIRALRVSPGTAIQMSLVQGERTMLVVCSPREHDALGEFLAANF